MAPFGQPHLFDNCLIFLGFFTSSIQTPFLFPPHSVSASVNPIINLSHTDIKPISIAFFVPFSWNIPHFPPCPPSHSPSFCLFFPGLSQSYYSTTTMTKHTILMNFLPNTQKYRNNLLVMHWGNGDTKDSPALRERYNQLSCAIITF